MATVRVHLTYPKEQISEPVVYYLGRDFDLVTNIRRASVSEEEGWILLELQGEPEAIESGIAWLKGRGVQVQVCEGGQ
jgi:hypothetical protein